MAAECNILHGIKKIPIGLSSFSIIQTEGYYYVDKTQYIETIENLNTKYPVLLRPRRFGKTLFLDTLKTYYDVREEENFEKLFGNTYIGKHRTGLANSYYVLQFDFSGLDTRNMANLELSFAANVKASISYFLEYYGIDMQLDLEGNFISYANSFLMQLGNRIGRKLYIMVDEYDHFANAMLGNKEDFNNATGKDGFIRSFYEVLKRHTTLVLNRIFITGVTSLTLDNLTSGFNIAENVSMYDSLSEAVGFTAEEAMQLINFMNLPDKEETMQLFTEHYDGYVFSNLSAAHMYNSNMILYYMNAYTNMGGLDNNLADPNIVSDYQKLSSMFDLFEDRNEKENVLQRLMMDEGVVGRIVTSFSLATLFTYDHFISLLYYLGLLTLKRRLGNGRYEFKTPNKVIKEIYYDYYFLYLTKYCDINESEVSYALEALVMDDVEPLIAVVEKIIQESTRNNDRYLIHFRENTLQMLFYLALRKSKDYYVEMEYRVGVNNYADILYSPVLKSEACYLFELKYVSAVQYNKEKEKLDHAVSDSKRQLTEYGKGLPNARYVAIVFIGKTCKYKELWVEEDSYS